MENKNEPKYDLSKTDSSRSLDCKGFSRRAKGRPSFDAYIRSLSREMQTYKVADTHKKDALRRITEKADFFLRRHAGISYENFLRQSQPETFTDNEYRNLEPEERRVYFERESSVKLSALADVEEKGYDVVEILKGLKTMDISGIKIADLLNQRSEDYLFQLLDISEQLAREEETPFNLLKKLKELNREFSRFAERYAIQRLSLEDRLRLREEEKS